MASEEEGEEGIMRSYLLGDLSPTEEERLEDRLMTERAVFDELLCLEDELIDSFVRDDLGPEERQRFLEHFLRTSERRRRVEFTRALRRYVEAEPAEGLAGASPVTSRSQQPVAALGRVAAVPGPRRFHLWRRIAFTGTHPALAFGAAAAWLVVLVGGPAAMIAYRDLGRELDQVAAAQVEAQRTLERERASRANLVPERDAAIARADQLGAQLSSAEGRIASLESVVRELRAAIERGTAPVRAALSVARWLTPGSLRATGQETPTLELPAETALARLQLDIGIDDFASYRASLRGAERGELLTRTQLTATTLEQGVAVVVSVPGELLEPGDYSVVLTGVSAEGIESRIDSYSFRVAGD